MIRLRLALAAVLLSTVAGGLEPALKFQHPFISQDLPVSPQGTGDYGLTALVDLDRGGRFTNPSQLYWFEFQAPDRWEKHVVGNDYPLDVGLAALGEDGDIDICSKPWGTRAWNALGGKMHVDFLESRLRSK